MRIVEFSEQRCLVIVGHLRVIQVEPFEERLVQQATDHIRAVFIQLTWVGQQPEGITEHVDAEAQFRRRVGESGLDASTLDGDLLQLGLDLARRHRVIGECGHQSVFLLIELLQLPLEGSVPFLHTGGFVGQRLVQKATKLAQEVLWQAKGLVVINDRLFDHFHPQMRQIAECESSWE